MDQEKKSFGAWWVWVVILCVGTLIVLGVLNAFGIVGRTIVEREVFERSFQYQKARQSEQATFRAQIAELESRLSNPALEASTRAEIQAQLSALRVRMQASQEMSR